MPHISGGWDERQRSLGLTVQCLNPLDDFISYLLNAPMFEELNIHHSRRLHGFEMSSFNSIKSTFHNSPTLVPACE